MSATSALSDRIMIHYNNSFPEWNLSPQVLLNCEREDKACLYTYNIINNNIYILALCFYKYF